MSIQAQEPFHPFFSVVSRFLFHANIIAVSPNYVDKEQVIEGGRTMLIPPPVTLKDKTEAVRDYLIEKKHPDEINRLAINISYT
jgi:hypothetical protein